MNFEFTYLLGKMLVLPSIQPRYRNSNGFQFAIVNKLLLILGNREVSRRPLLDDAPAKCGRCLKCVKAIVGCNDYKKARKFKGRKYKNFCVKYMSAMLRMIVEIVFCIEEYLYVQ